MPSGKRPPAWQKRSSADTAGDPVPWAWRVTVQGVWLSAHRCLAAAVAAALFLTAPWSNTPGFLERAQAALTPPGGSILHFKLAETVTSKDFGCTLRRVPLEVWIDQTPPYRYRALVPGILNRPPASETARDFVCHEAKETTEIGSPTQPIDGRGFLFVPPNTLLRTDLAAAFFSSDPGGRPPCGDQRRPGPRRRQDKARRPHRRADPRRSRGLHLHPARPMYPPARPAPMSTRRRSPSSRRKSDRLCGGRPSSTRCASTSSGAT